MGAGIYRFTNKINGKVYVGSSINIDKRYKSHIWPSSPNIQLRRAFKKYGLDNFSFEILEQIDEFIYTTRDEINKRLLEREQIYLDFYFAQEFIGSKGANKMFKQLTYNSNPTAGGNEGRVYTEKTKLKMSKIMKKRGVSVGIKNPNFGKKITPEKANKLREAFKKNGRIFSFYKLSPSGDIEGPFENLRKYSRDTGLIRKGISLCLDGKIRQYKGFAYCLEKDLESKIKEINNNPKYWIQIRKKYRNEQVSKISK